MGSCYFSFLIRCITVADLPVLKQPCLSGLSPIQLPGISLLLYRRVSFSKVVQIFPSKLMRNTRLWVFCGYMLSLSYQVLISEPYWSLKISQGALPLLIFSCRFLCKVCVNSLEKFASEYQWAWEYFFVIFKIMNSVFLILLNLHKLSSLIIKVICSNLCFQRNWSIGCTICCVALCIVFPCHHLLSAESIMILLVSYLTVINCAFLFFLLNAGLARNLMILLLKEQHFCFIDFFSCFPMFNFNDFYSSLHYFLPSTPFGLILLFFFSFLKWKLILLV